MKRTWVGWRGAVCGVLVVALQACVACGVPPLAKDDSGGDRTVNESPEVQRNDVPKEAGRQPALQPVQPESAGGESAAAPGTISTDRSLGSFDAERGWTAPEDCECRPPAIVSIALEGQPAPGSCETPFDPTLEGSPLGMQNPKTNEHGDVAFLATYGSEITLGAQPTARNFQLCSPYGAGIFAWDNDDEYLRGVALAGQETQIGVLPLSSENYSGPTLNDGDQIAFSARNMASCEAPSITTYHLMEQASSAIFLGNVEHDELHVVVKQGDHAPGCGYFDEFYDLALNRNGEVAFIATYSSDLLPPPAPALDAADAGTLQQPDPPPPGGNGVFLAHGCEGDIEAIIRTGDKLEGTGGGVFCGAAGPWLNDKGDVLFQATCIEGGAGGYEGSIFIHRHDACEGDVEPFVLIGDHVDGATIAEIAIGQPGVNEEEAALSLTLSNAITERVIATKKLDDHDCQPEICAYDGEEVDHVGELEISNEGPTIAEDGTLAFSGIVGATDMIERHLVDGNGPRSAILTCRDQKVKVIALEGEEKPVDENMLPVPWVTDTTSERCMDGPEFVFGVLDEPSNANHHIVFRDVSEYPTGVFMAETPYCQ